MDGEFPVIGEKRTASPPRSFARSLAPSLPRFARPPVSTCELARINEVSRAESERIELQSHPAAHRLLFRPSDEKQSGRKSSLAHLWNSSHFRNGGSVLGGCPPLAGNISEIRVSFRPTNFRVGEKWPWNSERYEARRSLSVLGNSYSRDKLRCVSDGDDKGNGRFEEALRWQDTSVKK